MDNDNKMGNSLQHRPMRDGSRLWQWGLALCGGIVFWLLPLMVFLNLGHGLDIADTGHYYNTLSQFSEIRSMSSQYFLLWDMLPVGEGILENRLWVFGLFWLAGGLFSFGLIRFFGLDYRKSPVNLAGFLAIWASVYAYYFWWVPDPSYNAMAVILLYALTGLVLWLSAIARTGTASKFFYGLAVLSGFLLAGFVMTRATSALLFFGLAIGFYLMQAKTAWSDITLKLAGFGLCGGILFLMFAHYSVEPLSVTWDRQISGLEMRQIRGRHIDVFGSISRFLGDIVSNIRTYLPWIFASLAGAVFADLRYIKSKAIRQILYAMSAFGFIGMAVKLGTHFSGGKLPRNVEVSSYLLLLTLALLAILLLRRLFSAHQTERKNWVVALLVLLAMPYIYAFGTGNLWMKQSLFAGGFLMTVCVLTLVFMRKSLPAYWHISVLAALLLVPYGVYQLAQNKPYRLPAPLSAQTTEISIRGGKGGTLKVDAATAKYLNQMGQFYDQFGSVDDRAYLIDLSGMSPFLSYHLDAKLMSVPWLIATEKNSQATFEFILARMDAEALKSAWIIDAPENKRHLDGSALRAFGINFPDDYELVLTARPPVSKKDIHLYRPKDIIEP
ncbi:MAG: hypothetical protein L3J05_05530 [Robiginitomaculum sp.]|nr:hypothetical protein [Robiginitomaculum sp.]